MIFENLERKNFQVEVNDQIVIERTNASQLKVQFGLDDRVILKRLDEN